MRRLCTCVKRSNLGSQHDTNSWRLCREALLSAPSRHLKQHVLEMVGVCSHLPVQAAASEGYADQLAPPDMRLWTSVDVEYVVSPSVYKFVKHLHLTLYDVIGFLHL